MHDFLRQDLDRWYPDIARDVQITVIEAQDQILGTFHSVLRDYAMMNSTRKGHFNRLSVVNFDFPLYEFRL